MKLKQQNLLYHFNSTIKSLETKLSIVEKLKSCILKSKFETNQLNVKDDLGIKEDIKKVYINKFGINRNKNEAYLLLEI